MGNATEPTPHGKRPGCRKVTLRVAVPPGSQFNDYDP